MSGSTWDWIGPRTDGNFDDASNWSLVAGPGNANNTPNTGDTAIINNATIALDADATLNSNTLFLTGTTTLDFTGDITGSTVISNGNTTINSGISLGNPTLDRGTVISNDPPGTQSSTTLNFDGYTINDGTIVSNDTIDGSSLTLNVNQDGTASGYFLNYGDIEADAGSTVTIAVNGTSELFNAGLVYANGGTVVFDGGTGIAGGYAPMLGGVALVGDGGTLEFNAGFPSGTKGSNPVFAFYDSVSGDTLKLDQIGQFGGRILGFEQGDTIDLGGALSIGTIAVTGDGRVLLESSAGSVIATLVLSSGNYTPGSYAVTAVAAGTLVAGGFTLTTGGDGDTLLTTDVVNSVWNVASSGTWQQATDWSTGVVPGANDTAVIGVDPTISATATISPFVVTTGSTAVSVGALIELNSNATLQITSATTVGLGTISYGVQQIAGEVEVTTGNTLTTTFLRQLGPSADLQIDTGAVLDLTGHADLGFANNGTLTETTVVNGTVFANGDTLGLFVQGTATVDGGLINAGPVLSGSSLISTGGLISIGQDGGGTPSSMTVENGGTVIGTYGYLSSDPTSFGRLTLTGAGTTWDDVGDSTDLYNTRGYMVVGGNNQSTNQPSPPPAGAAQLVVENDAVLNEALYASIGAQVDSAGSATITSGGVWNIGTSAAGGFLNVGNAGSGTLVISDNGTVNILAGTGTFTQNGTLITDGQGMAIAHDVGSDGTVIVDGGQLNLTINNTSTNSGLGVGENGHGVLDIFDGGTVSITNGGFSAGSDSAAGDGTITVGSGDGRAAVLEVASPTNPSGGGASIGKLGTGTMYVNALGTVDVGAGGVSVGRSAGSYGFVEINGGLVETATNGLTVGNAGTGTLELLNLGTVSLTGGGVDVGESLGAQGLLEIASGGMLTSTTNGMDVGLDAGSVGTLEVLAGGIYNISTHGISAGVSAGAVGTIVVDGTGAQINIGSETGGSYGFDVGQSGAGYLTVESNGRISDAGVGFNVGSSAGATGTVVVDTGGVIAITGAHGMTVGNSGTGVMTIGAGGTVSSANYFDIAQGSTAASGNVVVNGGTLDDGGIFNVGNAGAGTLTVEGGGVVDQTGVNFNIGGNVGSQGAVIVDGGALTSQGIFKVGGFNPSGTSVATLLVENSGHLVTGNETTSEIDVGNGTATATVTSDGVWSVEGQLIVGDANTGALTINDGGAVDVVSADIGNLNNLGVGHGDVTVGDLGTLTGNDVSVSNASTGTSSGTLTVDTGGTVGTSFLMEGAGGTINVTGSVTATSGVTIGQVGTGLAMMTVSSLGVVTDSGNFFVGNVTQGTLAVDAGGLVTGTGGNTLQIEDSSTLTVNGGTLAGFGDIVVGLFGAASAGTLDVVGGGTVEGTAVTVQNEGLLQAGSLSIGGAITSGEIGTLAIDTGGTVLVSTVTLGTGGVIDLSGGVLDPITMDVTGAGMINGSGPLDANVSFAASTDSLTYSSAGNTLEIVGSVTGAGTLVLATSSDIQLDVAPDGEQTVQFGPGTETLILATPALNTTAFADMTAVGLGDQIDFGGGLTVSTIGYAAGTDGQDVTVDFASGGAITLDNVQFTGGATGFKIVTDSSNGDSGIQAACYAAGTRIATMRGEIAVEDLRVGDLVQTVLGEASAPIIWIGRREVDCARHPKPRQVWPVRVAAGAFGPGRPHTDLLLSPDHAVYVNDVLIPIQHLINDTTIMQIPMDRITYYHVELPQHDVVLAAGLPAESYLDMRDGSNYANRPGPTRVYPDFSARMWEAFGCAPLIVTGPELTAARALVGGFTLARDAA